MNLIKNLTVITLAAAMGYGCGGGGGSAPATPDGIYSGTVTGGRGTPPNGDEKAIIYNGRMMVFPTVDEIQSLFDSQLTITDTSFTGALDIYTNVSLKRSSVVELTGTFIANTSITASFTITSGNNLTDGTINLNADTAIYNKGSNAATVTGSWSGVHGGAGDSTSLAIDATGNITSGTDTEGCNFTGTVIPADTSVNVYNVTIVSTGGAGCVILPAATYTGLAWTEGAADGTLFLSVANGTSSRTVKLTKI